MKENKILKTLLFMFIIISIVLGGYIIYDKSFTYDNKNNDLNTENNKTEEKNEDDSEIKSTEEKILEIIDEELMYLIGKKNLTELTDTEKSYMIMEIYASKNNKSIYELENITTSELEEIKNNSSLKKWVFNYEEIKYFDKNGINLMEVNEPLYYLKDGTYNRAPTGHGTILTNIYKCDKKIEKTDGKYVVNIKYAFARSTGDGPTDYELYYKIDDIKNYNTFKTIEYSEEQNKKTTEYFSDNCENIKDKLNTYTYVFEIEKDLPILTEYYYN